MQLRFHDDPILHTKTKPVTNFIVTSNLVMFMLESMQRFGGCGLAAPQIGSDLAIMVYDIGDGNRVMINPEIIETEGSQIGPEGCLSLPGFSFDIKRALNVRVTYNDGLGMSHTKWFGGFEAVVIQHEIDHLNGILMTEHVRA